jgi:hypothetical protein
MESQDDNSIQVSISTFIRLIVIIKISKYLTNNVTPIFPPNFPRLQVTDNIISRIVITIPILDLLIHFIRVPDILLRNPLSIKVLPAINIIPHFYSQVPPLADTGLQRHRIKAYPIRNNKNLLLNISGET